MLFAEEYLNKIAMTGSGNNGIKEWENSLDDKTRHERELIRRSQGGDFMAYKELLSLYTNVINSAVSSSGLNSVMDYTTAQQEGLKAFKDLVMNNFDLTKKNKPSTYIIGQLPNVLRKVKYNNRDFAGRKSEELSMHAEAVSTARNFLKQELGRDPSLNETFNFVKDNLRTGKSLTIDKIKRIDALTRREISGNVQIGGTDRTDGAEFLTLTDITNVDNKTPEEIYETDIKNRKIEEIIMKLPKEERRLVRNMYGLGEFKNKKATSLNSAVALNSGMTYYEAKKIMDKFKEMVKNEGLI